MFCSAMTVKGHTMKVLKLSANLRTHLVECSKLERHGSSRMSNTMRIEMPDLAVRMLPHRAASGTIRRSHPSHKILNQFHALAGAFLIGEASSSGTGAMGGGVSTLALSKRSSMLFFWAAFACAVRWQVFLPETVSRLTDVLVCDKMLGAPPRRSQSGCPWFS